jgi:UDP-glucuronate decarboxylase
MRHLVTGGSGFIGSHLIDHLMADVTAQVICVDNFQTGSKGNVAHWLEHPRFELIRHDVTEPLRIEVDRVWHLACPASPIHYQANPISTSKTNVLGTLNMLGLARRCGARFLLASTSEVYGDPLVSPQSETYLGNVSCMGPRACYDEGKRMAETLAFDYHRVHGLQVRVARIFNTYGPRMAANDGRVVTSFIHQALRSEPLTVYGDGSQTRSFCYVDDLVAGLLALMDSSCLRPVNLGNPVEITVAELAEQIIDRFNPQLTVSHHPLPEDDPRQRRPNISRAQHELGWMPTVPLEEGLARMVAALQAEDVVLVAEPEMAVMT